MSRPIVAVLLILMAGALVLAYNVFPLGDDDSQPAANLAATTNGNAAAAGNDLVAQGRQLSQDLGCLACHSTNGNRAAGPTWKGLYGSTVTLRDGSTVQVDDEYIRESIVQPDNKIREGFAPGVMTPSTQQHRDTFNSGNNLEALVAYIRSLS